MKKDYNSLICINTCNRIKEIKSYTQKYIDFCKNNKNFDFLLSVDGSNKKVLDFANKSKIPCIYSDKREGVGISKNRVFKTFNNYDYYFFIEDDVELVNDNVFVDHIQISLKTKIPHFSLYEQQRTRDEISKINIGGKTIIHAMYGSAQFNFFTREGLLKVGGWHTKFAKYKRFGHTEHSYRFFWNKLCLGPFNVIKDCLEDFKWHNPPPVTKVGNIKVTEKRVAQVEQDIIIKKLKYFPFKTICGYHLNRSAQKFKEK